MGGTNTQLELPEGVHRGSESLIRLSEAAVAKALELQARENSGGYLRLRITGGGCNGLSYNLAFVEAPKKGDIVLENSGLRVVTDPKSALYLRGSELDYSHQLVGGGFKFSNPNATSSCSCGESFSV